METLFETLQFQCCCECSFEFKEKRLNWLLDFERQSRLTVLECLDALAALLTTFDLVPGCNPERCTDVTVCSLTQSCRWKDGQICVGQCFPLVSLFS